MARAAIPAVLICRACGNRVPLQVRIAATGNGLRVVILGGQRCTRCWQPFELGRAETAPAEGGGARTVLAGHAAPNDRATARSATTEAFGITPFFRRTA